MVHWLTICLGLVALYPVHSLDNGVARTPPMGWLAWERFRCNVNCASDASNCISEKLFMQMADHLAADGYKDKGYEFINIDDCWAAKERDSKGNLQADLERFPHGIKYLVDYVHSKGLKMGIYTDYGSKTCAGYPGSGDHLEQDVQTFADWGIDMLKMDGCNANITEMPMGYSKVAQAINSTGRPIVFSCSWPAYWNGAGKTIDYGIAARSCNLWRNYADIQDNWKSVEGIVNFYTQRQLEFQPYAGPGHWNDPDMIIVGNSGLTLEQQKAQMGIWSIFAAPLLMSNDLRDIPQESVEILQNSEVIAVNQDPLGIQGSLIDVINNTMILSRPLVNRELAVVFFHDNEDDGPITLTIEAVRLGITSDSFTVRDLFAGEPISTSDKAFTVTVPAVGIVMVKITVSY